MPWQFNKNIQSPSEFQFLLHSSVVVSMHTTRLTAPSMFTAANGVSFVCVISSGANMRQRLYSTFFFIPVLVLLVGALASCGEEAPASPLPVDTLDHPIRDTVHSAPRAIGTLADDRLKEVSGLAASRRSGNVFWVHNDSGDEPRLFAVDSSGRVLAVVTLASAVNEDWEDIASATVNGVPYLYVGDTGDNGAARSSVTVYRIVEPVVDSSWSGRELTIPAEHMTLTYPDGARDCEALAVDAAGEVLYLVEKTGNERCGVYRATWKAGASPRMLERAGDFHVPHSISFFRLVTAADYSADGRVLLLRTYAALHEYAATAPRTPMELLSTATPVTLTAPALPQAEAVCISADTRDLFTVSEGKSQQLYRIGRPTKR